MSAAAHARKAAAEALFAYPLLEALTHRRSRRFSLGATIPGGGLAYESRRAPVPLTKLEQAMLCFAATGVTGLCLDDVPHAPGAEKETGGGNVMASLLGRTGASADAVHGAALFVIDDEATWMMRRPQDLALNEIEILRRLAEEKRFEEIHDRMRVKIRDGRTSIPREVPFVFPFNKWSTNLPGSTYFIPACDLSAMTINVALSLFDDQMAMFVVDDRKGLRPAGLQSFARSRGGRLHDDPARGRVIPILELETIIVEFMLAEQAFMVHDLSLMEQAMGLGGWTHFATAAETAWLAALGFQLGEQRLSRRLSAGFFRRLLMRLAGADRAYPHALGLTVDGVDLIKPYCPPYYRTMEDAVLAYLDVRRRQVRAAPLRPAYPGSWKDPGAVQAQIPEFSDAAVAATIAYATYVHRTYGRFPAYFGPLRTTLGHQAHHLDLDFYDTFYHPGAYTPTQAAHMACWHGRDGSLDSP